MSTMKEELAALGILVRSLISGLMLREIQLILIQCNGTQPNSWFQRTAFQVELVLLASFYLTLRPTLTQRLLMTSGPPLVPQTTTIQSLPELRDWYEVHGNRIVYVVGKLENNFKIT